MNEEKSIGISYSQWLLSNVVEARLDYMHALNVYDTYVKKSLSSYDPQQTGEQE